jgi:hypothetical protein
MQYNLGYTKINLEVLWTEKPPTIHIGSNVHNPLAGFNRDGTKFEIIISARFVLT